MALREMSAFFVAIVCVISSSVRCTKCRPGGEVAANLLSRRGFVQTEFDEVLGIATCSIPCCSVALRRLRRAAEQHPGLVPESKCNRAKRIRMCGTAVGLAMVPLLRPSIGQLSAGSHKHGRGGQAIHSLWHRHACC